MKCCCLMTSFAFTWALTSAGPAALAADAPAPKDSPAAADAAKAEEQEPELEPLSPEDQKLADDLKAQLKEGSEARSMLEAVLSGSYLGSEDGWFTMAFSDTRYPWDSVAKKYDADQDGKISREEFPGGDAEFARLDRDFSESIEPKDLEWKEDALFRSPITELFFRSDKDSSGSVSREELAAFFDKIDTNGAGEFSLDDLKDSVAPRRSGPSPTDPTRGMLLRAFSKQELGAFNPGLAIGDKAADFTLRTVDGLEDVRLSEQYRDKPLVLVFGNYTCGPFRAHTGNVERVFHRYKDRANFLMVYVREAHPKEGWKLQMNSRYDIEIPQPATQEERVAVAARCQKHTALPFPMVVDRVDDEVGKAYSGMPSRLYLIDTDGTIAYRSGRGPFGFKPAELEQSLIWLLSEDPSKSASENGAPDKAAR